MRRSVVWLSVCVSLAALACVPLVRAQEPSAAIRLDVPFVEQERNGCGSASLAMLMEYWQRETGRADTVDAKAIQRALYSPKARGIYASDLQRYLDEHGYTTFALQGTWDDLREQLSKGRPAIVALKVGRGDLHYVVITGIDPREDVVFKNDPAERKLLKQSRASFEKEWKSAASWMLLAVPEPAVQQASLR
jgi:ABC-type bacteriocin/lantibiotic exporter with double-glycine peptidase domain